MKTVELRDYTIQAGQLDRFVELWSRGIRPLHEKKGFHVEAAWRVPAEERFVWVVSYDGPNWDAAQRAYYDSPERKALDPDPAALIVSRRKSFIEGV
ncbi:MAG: NIPSNAP family containing protein [Chloroflexi bacterium]|nr:MAG: NIPSNAP family containing protein [Chloroflexota bacterium]